MATAVHSHLVDIPAVGSPVVDTLAIDTRVVDSRVVGLIGVLPLVRIPTHVRICLSSNEERDFYTQIYQMRRSLFH